MKDKAYFSEINEETTMFLSDIIEEMKERGLSQIEISIPQRETKTDYFFCKKYLEVGMKGDEYDKCGKDCRDYAPRNKKSGCCINNGYCYIPGQSFLLNIEKGIKIIRQNSQ